MKVEVSNGICIAVENEALPVTPLPIKSPTESRPKFESLTFVPFATNELFVPEPLPANDTPEKIFPAVEVLSSFSGNSDLSSSSSPPPLDRLRQTTSCKRCYLSKVKCAESRPCARCVRLNVVCEVRPCQPCKANGRPCDPELVCGQCKYLGIKCGGRVIQQRRGAGVSRQQRQCQRCRNAHKLCDEGHPCSRCRYFKAPCVKNGKRRFPAGRIPLYENWETMPVGSSDSEYFSEYDDTSGRRAAWKHKKARRSALGESGSSTGIPDLATIVTAPVNPQPTTIAVPSTVLGSSAHMANLERRETASVLALINLNVRGTPGARSLTADGGQQPVGSGQVASSGNENNAVGEASGSIDVKSEYNINVPFNVKALPSPLFTEPLPAPTAKMPLGSWAVNRTYETFNNDLIAKPFIGRGDSVDPDYVDAGSDLPVVVRNNRPRAARAKIRTEDFHFLEDVSTRRIAMAACVRCWAWKVKCSVHRPCETCERAGAPCEVRPCKPCQDSGAQCDSHKPCSPCRLKGIRCQLRKTYNKGSRSATTSKSPSPSPQYL
eukprot:98068_1